MKQTNDPFDLMDGLESQLASELMHGVRPTLLAAGEELTLTEDDAAVLVSRGQLVLAAEADADGRERTVTFIDRGELMVAPPTGWEDATSRISCRAVDETVVVPIDRRRFTAWMANPTLAARIVRHLAAQVADRSVSAATALEMGVERRVLLKLQQLAHRYGEPSPEGIRLDMKLTHQQIASMVGAVRESVTIALGRLQIRGDIIIRKRTIWIPHPDRAAVRNGEPLIR